MPDANLHQETSQGKRKSNGEKPMGINASELRRVMGHFATGVTVVTTHDGDGRAHGLTANAVCSLSLVPPLVIVCVEKRAESHLAVARSRVFAVNILAEGQEALSRRFAVSGGEKFAGLKWRAGVTGAPILEDSLGYVECRVSAEHDGGDHTVYVGEVESGTASLGRPLLFFRGRYHYLREA
jgi:flavin reductase (DIM6/NTAB) family NADH-FMN oxidoreductase RutF